MSHKTDNPPSRGNVIVLDAQGSVPHARSRADGSQSYKNNGPCPMHEVVLMAVNAAVSIEMAN